MLASAGEMEAVAGGEGGVESEGGAGWAISCFCSSAGEPGVKREEMKEARRVDRFPLVLLPLAARVTVMSAPGEQLCTRTHLPRCAHTTSIAPTAPVAPRGILQDVVSSIFEPGTNSGLVQAMSYSFYALFVTLIGMICLTGGNIHVCALFALSVGLFISIRWCVTLVRPQRSRGRS